MADEKDKPINTKLDADAFERELTTDLDAETPDKPKGLALHTRILIGLAVGVVAGVAVNWKFGGDHPRVIWIVDNITNPVGQVFLRSLLMIVVPLVFASLVVGVAGIGDIRKLGRVGLKSFGYCLILSAISVVIGLTLANTIKPGKRVNPETARKIKEDPRFEADAKKRVSEAIGATASGPVTVTDQKATATSPVSFTVIAAGEEAPARKTAAPEACAPRAIQVTQTSTGTLTAGCRSSSKENAFYATRYSFTAPAGQQVAISVTASDFNASVYLLGPNGSVIARNDDGAGDPGARVPAGEGFFRLAENGTYIVEVTSFSANATGNFTIAIDAPTGAPTITGVSPATATVGSAVSVTGTNFTPATVVRFNGLKATTKFESPNLITATVPAPPTDSAFMQVVKSIIPSNPLAAIVGTPPDYNPNMLHLMFFALIVGIAITLIPASVTAPFLRGLQALYEITAKIIEIIMKFAPFAVACLLFNNTARFGLDLLQALAWFIVTVLLGLSLHMFGVYSISIALLSRLSPIDFFRRIKTVILTAFSTSSSNATLPTALRISEQNLGVPQQINSFVLTVGATANQNGTALYEGVTVLFLAQLAGVDLSLGQQLMVVYLAILGGIGTAGVPSGSIPFIIGVLVTIGVNPALIAIILGVDRILDMCRTTLNVTGDITAATYVARSEGYELLKPHDPAIVGAGVPAK
ncbi:MAG TPA: cation:dicarboxylase symporter family transporter [Pyrinomonadaceae bacterium]